MFNFIDKSQTKSLTEGKDEKVWEIVFFMEALLKKDLMYLWKPGKLDLKYCMEEFGFKNEEFTDLNGKDLVTDHIKPKFPFLILFSHRFFGCEA